MESKINVLVLGIPFHEGMAGSKRVKNLLLPLYEKSAITISNLILTDIFEVKRIGENGNFDGIDYRYIGYVSLYNIFSVIKFYRHGFKFIRQHIERSAKNIIYCYGYPDLKNLPFIFYAKSKNCKVIFDIVEDNRHNQVFYGIAGKIRNRSSIFLLKKLPYFGDGVIAITTHLENWLNALYFDKVKIINIPITIDVSKFDNATIKENKGSDIITIFYGGSFAPKDGLEYLIDAFEIICQQHNNVRLVLTGIGKGIYMDKLMVKINNNPNIEYLGFLSSNEYYSILINSDICCMTRNNSEFANAGFPFKLGEFLAAGKAIIATNVGDVSLYLTDRTNALLIQPESTEEIVDAMLICLENKMNILQKLGLSARATALQYFDGTMLSGKLNNFLRIL